MVTITQATSGSRVTASPDRQAACSRGPSERRPLLRNKKITHNGMSFTGALPASRHSSGNPDDGCFDDRASSGMGYSPNWTSSVTAVTVHNQIHSTRRPVAGLDGIIRGLGLVLEDEFTITDKVYEGRHAWFRRTVT